MRINRFCLIFLGLLFVNFPAFGWDGLDGVYFTKNCNNQRIVSSALMKRALSTLAKKNGGNVRIYSCYRSQQHQNNIRSRFNCDKRNCNGIVANKSQHTYGIAADVSLRVSGAAVCHRLNEVRAEVLGGAGGVGGYGGNLGHLDLRQRQTNWNVCGRVLGRGKGYIAGVSDRRRTSFYQQYVDEDVELFRKQVLSNSDPIMKAR